MITNFNIYSRYYDLLYKDKDYESESKYVSNLIKSYHSKAAKLLEIGCGSGAHASYLVKEGFEICGIDRSDAMVAIANSKKIKNFNATTANADDFHLNMQFDAAISLFHVISYLTDNQALIRCFNLVHSHLADHGVFIFDIWYSPAVYIQKPETRIKRLEDEQVKICRIAESNNNVQRNTVEVNFEVLITNKKDNQTTILNETHPMRHFSLPEIELLATFTGFRILNTEEFLTGKTASERTWGVCFVLQKITNEHE